MKHDEYRQLTFLFCDVVDSTAMAQRLDVEDWRRTLRTFQETCSRLVRAHGGCVHDNPGDGLLAYFGYPATSENSAVDAVRAALDITRGSTAHFAEPNRFLALARLEPLRVRIGVHTGPVVLGSVDGRLTATGIPLHITERLHGHAAPNAVLISETTRHLIDTRFELAELGPKRLKGFETPALCFRVERESTRPAPSGTPFVGRRAELALLEEAWRTVRAGTPKVALVTGEAGIGKSRLLRRFADTRPSEEVRVVCWRGAEDARHRSLRPLVEYLRQALADLAPGTPSAERRIDALESLVPDSADRDRLVPVMASLLSLPTGTRYPPLEGTAKGVREVVQAALVDWTIELSRRRPLLLVLEDVPWMDPSTLQVIERIARDARAGPALLLMSCRTDTSHTWSCPFPARLLALGRLPADDAQAMILSSPGAAGLSAHAVRQVADRSDGVPLFIEESAAMAIDAAATGAVPGAAPPDRIAAPVVPARLTDLLVERLDRVGEARETAGVAAAIGREFTHALLRSVSNLDEGELENQLRPRLHSGLVKTVDGADGRAFCFKHALVRDAAYGTLLASRRRAVHARIADALAAGSPDAEPARPERLAHHCTEAGLLERAVEAWLDAGRGARRRSEQAEAIEYYKRVPDLLDRLPADTPYPIPQRRLSAQLALAACHVALDGYSSEAARRLYEDAERLADSLGQADQIFNARLGLETYYHMRGDFGRAMRLAESCRDIARRDRRARRLQGATGRKDGGAMALAKSNWAIGAVHFHRGRFDHAMTHLARCLGYCEEVAPGERAALQDPVVMCRVYRAWYAWERGRADEALHAVEETVARARDEGHAFSLGVALAFNACIHLFRREHAAAADRASDCLAVCERSGFRTWLAWAMILRGRARCEHAHDRRGGFADLREGLRIWDEIGAIVTRPFSQTLLAEAYLLDDRPDRALASVRRALRTVERHGERYYEAEIRRVHAAALLHPSRRTVDPASTLAPGDEGRSTPAARADLSLRRAIAFASERGLHASVLRSSVDLLRLHGPDAPAVGNGALDGVTDSLETALEAIAEGDDGRDVRRGRELLHGLRARTRPAPIAH